MFVRVLCLQGTLQTISPVILWLPRTRTTDTGNACSQKTDSHLRRDSHHRAASAVLLPRPNRLTFFVLPTDRPPHQPHGHGLQTLGKLLPLIAGVIRLWSEVVLMDGDKTMLLVQRYPVYRRIQPHLHPHGICLGSTPFHDEIPDPLAAIVGVREDDIQIWR